MFYKRNSKSTKSQTQWDLELEHLNLVVIVPATHRSTGPKKRVMVSSSGSESELQTQRVHYRVHVTQYTKKHLSQI
jgi:hypothetical protein